MKVVQINISCGSGSTGKICVAVSRLLTGQKVENYILYGLGQSDEPSGVRYADARALKLGALTSRLCGNWGFENRAATKKLIAKLREIKPDIVHLHNLHSHICQLEMLFDYLRREKIKVFWTFHDCWAFTGYCMHYDMFGCDRWETGCHNCPQQKEFSWLFDRSAELQKRKEALIRDVDLTVVAPSRWMAEQAKRSLFRDTPVCVIYNGVDRAVFQPRQSDFRKRHGLEDKFLVLGVAFDWGKRKGLDVFSELAKQLDDRYRIVLVGTNAETDKLLPDNILSVHRTADPAALAEIYTAADVFANPTREEVLGLVNLESLACGTPVVTFRTGGSPECPDESCGAVVEKDDTAAMLREIRRVCEERPFTTEACISRAAQFDEKENYNAYLALYGIS